MLRDGPKMLIPLGRGRFGRSARHGSGPWWHNHPSIGVSRSDFSVDAILVVGAFGGERGHWAYNLVEQGTDLQGVIDVVRRQLGRDDPPGVGVHTDMQLAPQAACPKSSTYRLRGEKVE